MKDDPLFHPSLISLDSQAEAAYLQLRCERSRETFVEALAADSGRPRSQVEQIVSEHFPDEGQAVSPAAPFNPKLFKTGMLVLFDCFIAAFDLYWILRIFL